MSLAEIRARSRRELHKFMAQPVSFYSPSGDLFAGGLLTARLHDQPKVIGDLAGTNLSYAEVHERPTRVVFWNEQIQGVAMRRACVIIFQHAGFFVETVMPSDGLSTTVEVSIMKDTALQGKVRPDGTVIGAE